MKGLSSIALIYCRWHQLPCGLEGVTEVGYFKYKNKWGVSILLLIDLLLCSPFQLPWASLILAYRSRHPSVTSTQVSGNGSGWQHCRAKLEALPQPIRGGRDPWPMCCIFRQIILGLYFSYSCVCWTGGERQRDRESSNFTHLPFSIVQIDEWIIVLVWEDGDERNLQNLFSFSNMEFWDSTMTNNCIISPPSYVKTSFLLSWCFVAFFL